MRRHVGVWPTLVSKRGKRYYVARWLKADGSTGQRTVKPLTTRLRDAERFCARLEEEVNKPGDVPWRTVLARYQVERLASTKASGHGKWRTARRTLTQFTEVKWLAEMDADLMSRFGAWLRQQDLATETVKGYLTEIRRTLRWAARIWPDYQAPVIDVPRTHHKRGGKGRPITGEEFERMLEQIEGVVGAKYAESWRHTLEGFWLSGLRLNDVHVLRWHTGPLAVQRIETDRPRLYIGPGEDKAGREESLPMWHFEDLVEFLRQTPAEQRRGHVFRPMLPRGRASYDSMSRTISAIGGKTVEKDGDGNEVHKGAAIIVDPGDPPKYASAHDLRRSFATRWAPKVPRILLRGWMRHRSYLTTDQYYVDVDLDTIETPERARMEE